MNEDFIAQYLRDEKGLDAPSILDFMKEYRSLTDIERSYIIYEMIGKELYKEYPVDMKTFIHDPYFLGPIYSDIIFPIWEKTLCEIYPAPFCKRYNEALLSCATRCFGKGTKIKMYDRSVKNVEDIQVGDKVLGPDLKPRTVLSTTKGREPLYKVQAANGKSMICNAHHTIVTYNEKLEIQTKCDLIDFIKNDCYLFLKKEYRSSDPDANGLRFVNIETNKKGEELVYDSLAEFSIIPEGEGDFYGFELDGDHLFLLDNGMVVHNSGKSTVVVVSALYEIYLLMCMISPSRTLNIKNSANITFCLLSKDNPTACSQLGEDMHKGLTLSPYFNDVITNNLSFSNLDKKGVQVTDNILLKAGSTVNVITGTDMIFGCLDEANMPSPKIAAEQLVDVRTKMYTAMVDRRNATFSKAPAMTGMIWLTSSPMDEGDVIGERMDVVRSNGMDNVFIMDNVARWEARQEATDDTFEFFLGSNTMDPCIIEESPIERHEFDEEKIIQVPRTPEYLTQFRVSPRLAIQEMAGRRTVAENAFFNSVSVFREVFNKDNHIFTRDDLRLNVDSSMDIENFLYDKDYFTHPDKPECYRYIHLDMAEKKDRFGIASVYCDMIKYTSDEGEEVKLRKYFVDFCIGISSSTGSAVDLLKVLEFIYGLKKKGYPVKRVTTDSHQGELARQILRRHGVTTEYQSVETSKDAYFFLKNLILTKTLSGFKNGILTRELAGLRETNKRVEKSKGSTDDLCDALAGACFLASQDAHFKDSNEAITEMLKSRQNVAGLPSLNNDLASFDFNRFNDLEYLKKNNIYIPALTNVDGTPFRQTLF